MPWFQKLSAYGVAVGHTHLQHAATTDGRPLVNPGSVGQPGEKHPDAAYGVLDTNENTVDLRRSVTISTAVSRKSKQRGCRPKPGHVC
ncbi:metallophosphoesterase family protein [Haloarcula marina]|uniref:metallophosphoesterase family protein n=1 Tax=Haloarcula marina TaxID=2961574 RepID=UPI0020B7751E|nr:metallophosphoesterase family protein [Halomicroarcula marina]